MSEIYSEYYNGDRKATVTLIRRSWDTRFNVWEVAMYLNNNVIQRSTLTEESKAENMAEDYVNGGNGSQTLLNEHVSNGQ
jgi:hypothetical protein